MLAVNDRAAPLGYDSPSILIVAQPEDQIDGLEWQYGPARDRGTDLSKGRLSIALGPLSADGALFRFSNLN